MTPNSNDYLISDDFNIFVISDGTGRTAHTVVEAALAQFELPRVNVLRFNNIKNKEEVFSIFDMVRHQKDIIVYTIVNEELAQSIMAEALSRNILAVDLLGPIVGVLKKLSSRKPRGEPG
ncbi:MAG TPA: kinase/pyrophosphorylase, partial [Atribacteraceae bacterium]|nr:kinase/pyrophosphorylase [Atribacteraceae bacterium]